MIWPTFTPGVMASTAVEKPFPGQRIFDPVDGRVKVYYGSTVSWRTNWALPWGFLLPVITLNSAITFPGVFGDVGMGSSLLTAVPRRKILTRVWTQVWHSGPGTTQFSLTDGANNVLGNRDGIVDSSTAQNVNISAIGDGTENGSVGRKIRGANGGSAGGMSGTNLGVDTNSDIMMFDIGSTAAPIIT